VKIWISKNSEVPVREQLIAQITLGIAAGDYRVGEKLPSTREIARRCGLHANTVGSAYQKLADQNLLEFRKGSGFYVTESAGKRIEGERRLDELIDTFLESAKALGFDEGDILKRLKKPKALRSPGRIVVIESDAGLREILVHELSTQFPQTVGVGFEELSSSHAIRSGTILTAMFDEKPKIDEVLENDQKCIYLKGRSVAAAMSGETRPSPDEIVAVISGWDGFLTFARIMLLAAKVDPGNLIVRSSRDENWEAAISKASIVICDSLIAHTLDGRSGLRPFHIIADESLSELASTVLRS
jgi:DNA-binding transcriptional regulator YhcF (GntR family)